MAIVFAIDRFRPYLYGRKFAVVTDHCSLCYLLRVKDPNGKLARWALKLQGYDYHIEYISGKKHLDVDALSRNPVDPPDEKSDSLCSMKTPIPESLCTLHGTNIKELQRSDSRLKPIISYLENDNTPHPKVNDIESYALIDEVLYYTGYNENERLWRLCLPLKIVKSVMKEIHETSAGHLGLVKTWHLIRSRYFWPRMFKHIQKFILGCQICLFHNRRTTKPPGKSQPDPPPSQPFWRIGIDLIGPFPASHLYRNCYVVVVIDHLTRYVETCAVKVADSRSIINVLEQRVIFRHSCPHEILTDQGTQFTSAEFKAFIRKYHIVHKIASTGNHNTNGVCERVNDTLKRILAKYVCDNQNDWDRFLQKATYSCNITVHSTNQSTPFSLLHGRQPYLPCDNFFPTLNSYIDDGMNVNLNDKLNSAWKQAYHNTVKFQNECKLRFDLSHPPKEYNNGDKVLLANYTRIPGKVAKWLVRWKGPFTILEKTGPINYLIEDSRPNSTRKVRDANVRHLKSYHPEYDPYFDVQHEYDECEMPSAEFDPPIFPRAMSHRTSIHSGLSMSLPISNRVCNNPFDDTFDAGNPQTGVTCLNPFLNNNNDNNIANPSVSVIINTSESSSSKSRYSTAPTSGQSHTAEEPNSLVIESSDDEDEPTPTAVPTVRRSTRTIRQPDRYNPSDYIL